MDLTRVEVDGVGLNLATVGQGPPLLFLNGSGSSIEAVSPILEILGQTFSVACHDQRGLGQSDIPEAPWTMKDYGRDALGIADHLGWDRFGVLGISFGGMVALEVAAQAPERLERLAAWCTSPGGTVASYPLHELAELPERDRIAKHLSLTDTRWSPWWFLGHPSDRALAHLQSTPSPLSKDRQRGARLQLEARRTHDVNGRLGDLTCPVLIGAGRFDGIAPPSNSEAIVREIPQAEMRIYEGGHLFMLQDARAFADTIEFLVTG